MIPQRVKVEWLALEKALAALEVLTPCQVDPAAWDSELASPVDRATAAARCRSCPALDPCGAYAVAAQEETGIWGGQDRGRPSRTSRWPV